MAEAERFPEAGRTVETPPFGRASFLTAWWQYLAPAWSRPVSGIPAAARGLSYTLAGSGAADYAAPEWTEEFQEALLRMAGRGLVIERVLEGTRLEAWCVRQGSLRIPYDVSPRMDLSPGWEAVQERRSSKTWSSFRRKRRKLEKAGPVRFVHVTGEDELLAWLPTALSLYRARASRVRRGLLWTTARGQAFLRTWMRGLAREGRLDLAFLVVDDSPEAFTFGIRDPRSYYLYGLAFDPGSSLSRWSPGEHLLVHLMEQACQDGIETFDFLVGDEPYKRAWADASPRVDTHVLARGKFRREMLAAWPRARQMLRARLGG